MRQRHRDVESATGIANRRQEAGCATNGIVFACRRGMATIAIINSSEDTVEMLRALLEREGWRTAECHLDDIKRGRIDFLKFLETHDPGVIIYDVPPPYDQNWAFLRLLRSSRAMESRVVIVTTTNKPALERFVGPTDALEIFTKPYDVDMLVETITRTLKPAG
jgi:DNA-binding NtrC family response regulator